VSQRLPELTIIIRGAGDLASGVACRLHRAGFSRLLMTEIERPLAVRRMVCFCEAVYEGGWSVEGIQSFKIASLAEAGKLWEEGVIPILVDPENNSRHTLKPDIVIDAIMAKKNIGTRITDAPLVIGLGPGFIAGTDVHYVIETNRGHDMGRLIQNGSASPDTGVPGDIGGKTNQRVVRSPVDGIFCSDMTIGSSVTEGSVVGSVSDGLAVASLTGVLRGLIRPGTVVTAGLKIGDVDPRNDRAFCFTVSEKARALGGSILEAILTRYNRPHQTLFHGRVDRSV
jgi:xanthine dehydrogenase accessory factor